MALPVEKIISVLVKQLAKPIADRVKAAATSKVSLTNALARFGKLAFHLETRLNAFLLGKTAPLVSVPSKKDSIQRGADVLGEAFIFGVAVTATVSEYVYSKNKSAKKEVDKERKLEQRFEKVKDDTEQVSLILESISTNLTNLRLQLGQVQMQNDDFQTTLLQQTIKNKK
eukprot:c5763_g1_i1.p1 GENE.c5763_g1_i1~~c5763_g1_i1.p1  ORF type:complete len:171 (+),score=82.88 c5763_g1_i1:95-607(+)